MTSSVTSLVDYLKYLHLFEETPVGHQTKKNTSVTVEITQAIERLQEVYSRSSSVVMEDERRKDPEVSA